MARPTWVLADPHGGASAVADRALLALLDRALERRADLLVLGDLFRAFVAVPRFEGELERAVIGRFEVLRERGARIEMVVGNRDYGMREALLGRAFDAVHEEATVLHVGGRPTLVAHGDLLNVEDRLYRAWHALSRSRVVSAALQRIPPSILRRLVHRTEARLEHTNQAYKTGLLPITALENFGREARRRGAAQGLVGHFHHDRVLDVADGVPVVLAPGWLDLQRVLRVAQDGALESVTIDGL